MSSHSTTDTSTGRIVRIISNQYTIDDGTKEYIATPRGKLRLSFAPVVGDFVEFEESGSSVVILKVLERKNKLLRPTVSNVDQALIVTSIKDPDFSDHLLNRLLFLVELADIQPVICVTKMDMVDAGRQEEFRKMFEKYEAMGYPVFYSHPGSDDNQLIELLSRKVSVLCGQSGAGKSSLLNRLDPTFQLQTQEISKALGRGKHTTRHCQLHKIEQGLVADTPGFSSLEFGRMDLSRLDEKIQAFQPYLHECRFADCRHLKEPGCRIKEAVDEGKIDQSLYEDYAAIASEYYQNRNKY